jgi:hypothetical protein
MVIGKASPHLRSLSDHYVIMHTLNRSENIQIGRDRGARYRPLWGTIGVSCLTLLEILLHTH